MFIRLKNYDGGHIIASLAKTQETFDDMQSKEYNIVMMQDNMLYFYPQSISYELDEEECEKICELEEYSIIEFGQDAYVAFNCGASENALFITNRCNSSCIMCPTSSKERRQSGITSLDTLIAISRQIPDDTRSLIITGGEPFLLGKEIFSLFSYLKEHLDNTGYLLLTNGRIFSNLEYFNLFIESMPSRLEVAIPVHGHNDELHDYITQVKDSFRQTVTGIKRLLKKGVSVEIRVVVSKLNIGHLEDISRLIASEFKGVSKVTFIGLEMLGDAYKNRDMVWIDYIDSMKYIGPAVDVLVTNGINAEIYNYPLCCVEKRLWPICRNSISPHKIRYADECESCRVKHLCGGMFLGTNALLKNTVKAVE